MKIVFAYFPFSIKILNMSKIKFGIEAKILSDAPAGIGRYVAELCRNLTDDPDLSLVIYSPSAFNTELIDKLDNVKLVAGSVKNPVGKQLWLEFVLPFLLKRDEIDVFWAPAHRMPYFVSSKIPKILTVHDLCWKIAPETMKKTTRLLDSYKMPVALRKADIITAPSNSTAEDIARTFGISKKDVDIIPPASGLQNVDTDDSIISKYGLERKKYIVFVGTLEPRKNLKRLLKAYSLLEDSVKNDYKLVIAGAGGWCGVKLSDIVSQLNLDKNVIITGQLGDGMLASIYANAYFLVFPSLYEGFGIPIVEAMSFGVPVLTSEVSSMPEVAGDSAIFVDPFDEYPIYKGILELIENKMLYEKLAAGAVESASVFSWQKSANKLAHLIKKMINK
ncbi:MAG TPA: hypothetical protein DHM44_08400 [Flexistipes sinusarabici]|uniref:Glycosyltransferase family 1 protein n=1 Tax=Flexistipes sinusarabici TaxID=2352 RepID=A0A3D5QDG6_FLESI|nr:hypothetical protein [Flexistipes sinusarabici]